MSTRKILKVVCIYNHDSKFGGKAYQKPVFMSSVRVVAREFLVPGGICGNFS